MMAKVIWLVGLPNFSEEGVANVTTEDQRPLDQDIRNSIAIATETILNWLSMLANTIKEHKATYIYQEHARKSGTVKNKPGLNERELKLKQKKRQVARLKYGGQPSAIFGSNIWLPLAHWQWHGDTWEAPPQWQWHGNTWQAPVQWQWQPAQ